MWGQLIAAVVVILAVASIPTSTPRWGYALAVGIVSTSLALLAALLIDSPTGRKTRLFLPHVGFVTAV